MAYVAAHVAITEHLSGRADAAATLLIIEATAPGLGTRTGRPATDPLDYCLGLDAGRHELFLP